MKFQKRFVPLLLALVLALGTPPVQAAALTRGEAAQALLSAAQDYNPGVQRSDIPAGLSINGPFYGLSLTVNEQIAALIREIDAHEQTPGTAEAKIKALYDCVMDAEGREKAGVAPIQKYLDAIENAKTLDELVSVDAQMQKELGLSMLLGFGLTTDLADSSRRIAAFSLIGAGMDKDFYVNGADAQRSAFWRRTG